MKFIFTFLLTIFATSCTNYSHDLIYFANNYKEIAKTNDKIPTLSARIIKLSDFGECDNSTCPKEVIYIAISESGEYPEQKLYITEKADEWTFIKWNHIPDSGETDQAITFTLKRINNNNEQDYKVRVDLNTITYDNIKR